MVLWCVFTQANAQNDSWIGPHVRVSFLNMTKQWSEQSIAGRHVGKIKIVRITQLYRTVLWTALCSKQTLFRWKYRVSLTRLTQEHHCSETGDDALQCNYCTAFYSHLPFPGFRKAPERLIHQEQPFLKGFCLRRLHFRTIREENGPAPNGALGLNGKICLWSCSLSYFPTCFFFF